MASPVGHAAFGIATAAVVARVTGTPDSAALWIGATVACGIPDVDVILPLLGLNKRYHRNATHSLVTMSVVMGLAFATLRGAGLTPALGVALSWVAALLSHLVLDVITTGAKLGAAGWGIPLFWPVSRRRYHVRRPFLISDRPESHSIADTLREMREDAVRIVPLCAIVVLLTRL